MSISRGIPAALTIALLLFGIQIVAAQIATSSESSATSTEVAAGASAASSTLVVETATTTPAIPTAPATTTPAAQTATSTPPQASSPAPEPPKSVPPPQDTVALEISKLEDAYKQKTGRYLQVIAGNQLPLYESGTVSGKLGKNIPDHVSVDVYEAPNGKGYQIYFEENGTFYSYSFGPESTERTFTIKLPVSIATSTATTVQ